ncbi:MAG: pilus assembly protein PilM [Phycisphaerales bacterium]|nr:pilus assembly protein PilM [Phycisphaerales bacterium]
MSIRSIFTPRRIPPIGVEFSEEGLRLAQVASPGSDVIRQIAFVPFGPGGSVDVADLRKVLRGFRGRQAAIAPPRGDLTIRPARLPRLENQELREAARWEAAGLLELEAADVVAEPLVVSNGVDSDGLAEMLIVAGSVTTIESRLEPLLQAGLHPIGVEPAFVGAGRAFTMRSRRSDEQDRIRVVVDVADTESWIVVTRGDSIVFAKRSDVGGSMFDAELGAALGIDESMARRTRRESHRRGLEPEVLAEVKTAVRRAAGPLGDEAGMAVRYVTVAARLGRPECLHLCGEAGGSPGLVETLSAAVPGIPVEQDERVTSRLSEACGPDATPLAWATAYGLSLRPVVDAGRQAA